MKRDHQGGEIAEETIINPQPHKYIDPTLINLQNRHNNQ